MKAKRAYQLVRRLLIVLIGIFSMSSFSASAVKAEELKRKSRKKEQIPSKQVSKEKRLAKKEESLPGWIREALKAEAKRLARWEAGEYEIPVFPTGNGRIRFSETDTISRLKPLWDDLYRRGPLYRYYIARLSYFWGVPFDLVQGEYEYWQFRKIFKGSPQTFQIDSSKPLDTQIAVYPKRRIYIPPAPSPPQEFQQVWTRWSMCTPFDYVGKWRHGHLSDKPVWDKPAFRYPPNERVWWYNPHLSGEPLKYAQASSYNPNFAEKCYKKRLKDYKEDLTFAEIVLRVPPYLPPKTHREIPELAAKETYLQYSSFVIKELKDIQKLYRNRALARIKFFQNYCKPISKEEYEKIIEQRGNYILEEWLGAESLTELELEEEANRWLRECKRRLTLYEKMIAARQKDILRVRRVVFERLKYWEKEAQYLRYMWLNPTKFVDEKNRRRKKRTGEGIVKDEAKKEVKRWLRRWGRPAKWIKYTLRYKTGCFVWIFDFSLVAKEVKEKLQYVENRIRAEIKAISKAKKLLSEQLKRVRRLKEERRYSIKWNSQKGQKTFCMFKTRRCTE